LAQYDNVTDRLGINSRLRWMPQAGRELYFVIDKGKLRTENDDLQSLNDKYVLKVSYTLRF
jgi:hypothetical protein